jgi:hypothetical protein
MERSHAQEQLSAVHSGHIEIEDRKIESGKIATQCLYRGTEQYNCVALQLQNFPAKCQFKYVIVDAEDPPLCDLQGWLSFSCGAQLCQHFSAGYRAAGCGYRVIDSLRSKVLRRVFLARDKRDLVAATEMPANAATSFRELSVA